MVPVASGIKVLTVMFDMHDTRITKFLLPLFFFPQIFLFLSGPLKKTIILLS